MQIRSVFRFVQDMGDVVYPDICLACGRALNRQEKALCLSCQFSLPRTDHFMYPENPVAKKFWGKVRLENAAALFHFHKSGKIQHVLHALKYKGRSDAGIKLGQMLGYAVLAHPGYKTADMIVAVPLHPKREKARGYNQSTMIACGVRDVTSIPVDTHVLQRVQYSSTQTRKSRLERWENVSEIFGICTDADVREKHILLLDDVITTGSTLEACAVKLTAAGARVSIAAVAYAEQ